MSALLAPPPPSEPSTPSEDRPGPRPALVSTEQGGLARGGGEGPPRRAGRNPWVRRVRPAGEAVPRRALAGPQARRPWDPLRFQPDLTDQDQAPAPTPRRKPVGPSTTGGAPTSTTTPSRGAAAAPLASPQASQAPQAMASQQEVGVLVRAAAEVLLGLRPAEQMARWTTPSLLDALTRRAGLAHRLLGPRRTPCPVVRSVHLQTTPWGACEAAVVLYDGHRARAAAARLLPERGRWVLARLEIG